MRPAARCLGRAEVNCPMDAAWYEKQGPARDVLVVGEMPDPAPGPGEVRIRVAFALYEILAAFPAEISSVIRPHADAPNALARGTGRQCGRPRRSLLHAAERPDFDARGRLE
jgi:hypothetical protein